MWQNGKALLCSRMPNKLRRKLEKHQLRTIIIITDSDKNHHGCKNKWVLVYEEQDINVVSKSISPQNTYSLLSRGETWQKPPQLRDES